MAGVGLLGGLIQFFVVLGLSQAYARAHAAELAKRVRFPWGGSRPLALVALAFVGLPLLGGALNRIRGGWRPFGHIDGDTAVSARPHAVGAGGPQQRLVAVRLLPPARCARLAFSWRRALEAAPAFSAAPQTSSWHSSPSTPFS